MGIKTDSTQNRTECCSDWNQPHFAVQAKIMRFMFWISDYRRKGRKRKKWLAAHGKARNEIYMTCCRRWNEDWKLRTQVNTRKCDDSLEKVCVSHSFVYLKNFYNIFVWRYSEFVLDLPLTSVWARNPLIFGFISLLSLSQVFIESFCIRLRLLQSSFVKPFM